MKPFSMKGLAVTAALLLVPLLAAPALGQIYYFYGETDVTVDKPFDVPCRVLNLQPGEPAPTDLVVMAFRIANDSASDRDLDSMVVSSVNSDSGMVDEVYIYRESDAITPASATDFASGSDVLLGTATEFNNGSNNGFDTGDTLSFVDNWTSTTIGAGDTAFFYIVVDVAAGIVGEDRWAGASLGVFLDGDEPALVLDNGSYGPVDAPGVGGDPVDDFENDPNPMAYCETRAMAGWFEVDAGNTDLRLGMIPIDPSPARKYRGREWIHGGSFDKVPLMLIVDNSRSTLPDTLKTMTIRSRVDRASAIESIAIYKEDECTVPTDASTLRTGGSQADDLWAERSGLGDFTWGPGNIRGDAVALTMNAGKGVVPPGEIVYLYIVVDMNAAVIEASQASRENFDRGLVGLALNDTLSSPDPEAMVFGNAGVGPRWSDNGTRIVWENDLTGATGLHDGGSSDNLLIDTGESWDINQWVGWKIYDLDTLTGAVLDSGLVSSNSDTSITAIMLGGTTWEDRHIYRLTNPPGQPFILDTKPPELWCYQTRWVHTDNAADRPGLGDGVIDNQDNLSLYFYVADTGASGIDMTLSGRPRVNISPFQSAGDPAVHVLDSITVNDTLFWATLPALMIDTTYTGSRTDTLAGNLKLQVITKDLAGNTLTDSCTVPYNVDTRRPTFGRDGDSGPEVPLEFKFTPNGDLNGDGWAGIGDTLRITANMGVHWRNWNRDDGLGNEIDSVWADISSWGMAQTLVPLFDPSGDGQNFSGDFVVTQGGLDTLASNDATLISIWALDNADNYANYHELRFAPVGVDSPGIDNQFPPIGANTWTLFSEPAPNPTNNIINIGDVVRFEVEFDTTGGLPYDIDSVYVDLFEAGLGGNHRVDFTPPGSGSTLWRLDTTVLDPRLNNSHDFAQDTVKTDVCPNIPLYAGVRYKIPITIVDDRGNRIVDTVGPPDYPHLNGDSTTLVSVDTKVPEPVLDLVGSARPDGNVGLDWTIPAADTGDGPLTYDIYWDEGAGTTPSEVLATVTEINGPTCMTINSWVSDTTVVDPDLLECGETYRFAVVVRDDANNSSDFSETVEVTTDCDPPEMCVWQPDLDSTKTYSCHGCDFTSDTTYTGLTIYVQPKDSASMDVASIGDVLVRLKDRGGAPGPWTSVGFVDVGADAPHTFALKLNCDSLDAVVGTELVDLVELIIIGVDEAGNKISSEDALAACKSEFNWSTVNTLDGQIFSINDKLPQYKPYCGEVGFEVEGENNVIVVYLNGGTPPYTVRAFADDDTEIEFDNDQIFFMDTVSTDTLTFDSLDVTGWEKGAGRLFVEWCDANGAYASDEVNLCVPDVIAPCARVTNPMDGKCIPVSLSAQDPVPVTVTIDPLENCLDPEDVVKVDFEWSDSCCEGTYWDYFLRPDTVFEAGGDTVSCDTTYFEEGPFAGEIESIECIIEGSDTTVVNWVVDSTLIDCSSDEIWTVFGSQPGDSISFGDVTYWWVNTNDLAGYTTGDNIFIRARVFDEQGNVDTTECVLVCIDTDTPPVCLMTDDLCYGVDDIPRLSGASNTMYAVLDTIAGGITVDDVESMTLWYKKSTDADRYEHWNSLGAGVPATNSTMWRWDNVDVTALTDQVYYDFRVVVTTIWGTVSYDYDGDGQFDHNTFDTTNCDAATWWIDHSAENIWIDTVWTTVEGTQIVQPNTSCTLSDPRGWAWAQYGQDITVQPLVEPIGLDGDIVKVVWTLVEGEGCATCDCEGGFSQEGECDSKVIAINEDANALDMITFNPAEIAQFIDVKNGFQTHVLRVEAFDGCGNSSSDCIELFLLDIQPTEAIIVEPKNHEVFCQDHENEGGGITVTAQTLMADYVEKATFSYRAVGDEEWIAFEEVDASDAVTTTLTAIWYPHALGLDDGSYELKVVAEDASGNEQTNEYIITVHLSCGEPTVAMVYPEAETFIGCPLEVKAEATAPDAFNYITKVEFYFQPVTGGLITKIGEDEYSVDDMYSVAWNPSIDGDYYIWAVATVKSGVSVASDKVWVSGDETAPEVNMVEVGGDRSNGGSGDPTVIPAGTMVDIDVEAWDRLQADGYGPEDNCGLDSVKIYVKSGSTVIFGELTHPVEAEENMFTVQWPTAGLANGTYEVYAVATDSCCNNATSDSWYVSITNPVPPVTLSVDEAAEICEEMRVSGDEITVLVAKDVLADIDSVQIWVNNAQTQSDVYDQYTKVGSDATATNGVYSITVDISLWTESSYRLRAVPWVNGMAADDGNDADTEFDDFTFDPANKPWQMLLWVERTAPVPTFTLENSVISAGSEFEVTVDPSACELCDIDHFEYGVVTQGGVYGTRAEYTTTECEFSFDPVDSGLVTLENCYWGGYVRVLGVDALGNTGAQDVWVDILDVPEGQALVTSPAYGDVIKGEVELMAKWVGEVSDVVFFYSTLADDSDATEIGAADEDGLLLWDTEDEETGVADGEIYLWAQADGTLHEAACARKVKVVNDCVDVYLGSPWPYGECEGDQNIYVGGTFDLKVDSILSVHPIDSVVFAYKTIGAPGAWTDTEDPSQGWVWVGMDRYEAQSWDVSWDASSVPDGHYVVQAFAYVEGKECHSNNLLLYMDNTDPVAMISQVGDDQTPVTCADVTEGADVEITAVATDEESCARWAQFFAGYCGEEAGSGKADITFAIDYSGSMDEEIDRATDAVADFVNSLQVSNIDFTVGLINLLSQEVAQNQTTDVAAFITALENPSGGGGVGSYSVLNDLAFGNKGMNYRSDASKFVILITDTSPESGMASDIEFCDVADPAAEAPLAGALAGAGFTVYAVVEEPTDPSYSGNCAEEDHNAYDQIVSLTGGGFYDLDAEDYSPLFTEIADAIALSLAGQGSQLGGTIWVETVDLSTDDPVAKWNTTGLDPGTYCVWTVVTDAAGNRKTSQVVEVCVYDKTAPVAWIAGFGDATVACPNCEEHRIYGLTCDTDVESMSFQKRPQGSTSDLDWITIGIGNAIDNEKTLWYTEWNPCKTPGDWEFRAIPASDHYEPGTEGDVLWDKDASKQPLLDATIADGTCEITYDAGDVTAVTFEDKSSGDLGLVRVDKTEGIDPTKLGMLGIYQPLNEWQLTTEKVEMAQMQGVDGAIYLGSFNDQDICLGGVGSFFASYYDSVTLVSYLMMADITVSRVYPALGMPGTLTNDVTGASVMIERDAVSEEQGVVILPAWMPTMMPSQNDLLNVWPANDDNYLPAIRFTDCGGEVLAGLNEGKYAKIKIPYSTDAPPTDSLAVAWWDGDEWQVNVGIFMGGDAEGFDAENHTVEFYSQNLYGIYAVVSNKAAHCDGPITIQQAPHDPIAPWANSFTYPTPTFNTLVRSNIHGDNNNIDVDSLQTHVKLDGITIYNNGTNASGWITTWDPVSGLLQTRWNGAPGLEEGRHTYWVKARTFQGCAKTMTVTFEVDETPPAINWTHDYVCYNPEFKIVITDNGGAGVDFDNVQADVYDYDLSLGTEIPSDKLVYEEHASGFELRGDTLVFSLTAHQARLRRYVVVLWDGMSGGRSTGWDDDDRDYHDDEKYVYHNDHGVPDWVGNHATPVFRTFTVGGPFCDGEEYGETARNEPNPFDPWNGGEKVTKIYHGRTEGDVTVKIYDLAGEEVITLKQNAAVYDVGEFVPWDGKTDNGEYVASGVYLCHISGSGQEGSFSEVIKIAVIKRD